MDLNALQTFLAVVRASGFAAAARETDTPRSSVSLRIRKLERDLGVRLFKRSTRAFSLTAEGRELYRRSSEALAALDSALADLGRAGESYAGEIRVTAPADFPVRILAGAIAEFRREHPAVRFEVILSNDVRNLISENVDIALRIGASNPQDALVRGVLDVEFGFYASAEYLCRKGTPASLHAASTLIGPQQPGLRRLLSALLPEGSELPQFHIAADNFLLVRELVMHNQGVGLLPAPLFAAEVASGLVVPVLQGLISETVRFHLTYASRADLSAKVSAFGRTLARHLGARPV